MIETAFNNDGKTYVVHCDNCSYSSESESSFFDEAIEEFKEEGVIIINIDGTYKHFCDDDCRKKWMDKNQ